ncbi:hypothetical protein GCM10020331_067640 [Ectobacillus funiculus]
MKQRVLLVGVGLIGGSVALAIKQEHDVTIIGQDVNAEHCKLAQSLNIIDEITDQFMEEAERADLILLAAPVQETEKLLTQLEQCSLKEKCDYY